MLNFVQNYNRTTPPVLAGQLPNQGNNLIGAELKNIMVYLHLDRQCQQLTWDLTELA